MNIVIFIVIRFFLGLARLGLGGPGCHAQCSLIAFRMEVGVSRRGPLALPVHGRRLQGTEKAYERAFELSIKDWQKLIEKKMFLGT